MLDLNTSFERSLSQLSENHKMFDTGSTVLKLWLFKDVQLHNVVPIHNCNWLQLLYYKHSLIILAHPLQALGRYAESVRDLHLLLTIDPDNPPAKKELGETKQLWEKQLREIQARTVAKDKRPERRNSKSKKGKY